MRADPPRLLWKKVVRVSGIGVPSATSPQIPGSTIRKSGKKAIGEEGSHAVEGAIESTILKEDRGKTQGEGIIMVDESKPN